MNRHPVLAVIFFPLLMLGLAIIAAAWWLWRALLLAIQLPFRR